MPEKGLEPSSLHLSLALRSPSNSGFTRPYVALIAQPRRVMYTHSNPRRAVTNARMMHGTEKGFGEMRTRRTFGTLRRLPSKRWQASYVGPDDQRHPAPSTFGTKMDAEAWLAAERKLIEAPDWMAPSKRGLPAPPVQPDAEITLRQFTTSWLSSADLRPLTRRDYDSLLRNHILPHLGDVPLQNLSRAVVRAWYGGLPRDRPRARSKALQLLHTILNAAMDSEHLDANPAALGRRTAARPRRAKKIRPLTVEQVREIAEAMPDHLRLAVLLGCWCALRYGELAELRRRDVHLDEGVLHVERAVIRVKGQYLTTRPKTDAGIRDVHIPSFLLPELQNHLDAHVGRGRDSLLFAAPSGQHLHSTTFARHFGKAAAGVGRPDATPHYLRHTGASLATSAGATTADVMARLGHTTPTMAMVYQDSLSGADARVAEALSQLADSHSRTPEATGSAR